MFVGQREMIPVSIREKQMLVEEIDAQNWGRLFSENKDRPQAIRPIRVIGQVKPWICGSCRADAPNQSDFGYFLGFDQVLDEIIAGLINVGIDRMGGKCRRLVWKSI